MPPGTALESTEIREEGAVPASPSAPGAGSTEDRRRRLPPLNALRAFEAAARHGSFTRAAAELMVTQTAISHQVKSLEEHVGVRLFQRLHNGLMLTERGAAYLPVLREAFERIADATEELRGGEGPQALAVSTLPNFALRWLIPRLPRFHAMYPEVELRLSTTERGTDFLGAHMDVAVRLGEDWPGLNQALLFPGELFPVCSPELLRKGPLNSPADLAGRTLLHVSSAADDWPAWLKAAGMSGISGERGPRFDSFALVCEAALHGLGIAMARLPFVDEDLKAGRLIAPFSLRLPRDEAYHLIWPKGHVARPVTHFREWILAEAAATRGEPPPKRERLHFGALGTPRTMKSRPGEMAG
ncbi:transcriptional regulator GcvA [Roseomonas chloroacetimidivorans]|uniref:transcriptional regulator GcvA n=1 Tax=Roseomonas chloroacetimidivorans TaxID=1766656 RepID=UPI003C7890F7